MGHRRRASKRQDGPWSPWALLPPVLMLCILLVGAGFASALAELLVVWMQPKLAAAPDLERTAAGAVPALGLWLAGSCYMQLAAKRLVWAIRPARRALGRAWPHDYRGSSFVAANAGLIEFAPTFVILGLIVIGLGCANVYFNP